MRQLILGLSLIFTGCAGGRILPPGTSHEGMWSDLELMHLVGLSEICGCSIYHYLEIVTRD
jgi:hypothetical protein